MGAGMRAGTLLFLVCLAGCASMPAGHARIELSAARVLEGDPVSLRITGLARGAIATVHAQSAMLADDGRPEPYYSEATFAADTDGVINLATAVPVKGDYSGADLRGLFWSARPLSKDAAGRAAVAALHLEGRSPPGPGQVLLSLEVDGVVQEQRTLTLDSGALGVVREAVRTSGLTGVLYHAPGARRRPVVVVLGGSEGGLDVAEWAGPRLAARGFVVFGIDYFDPLGATVGVPTALASIPVELLERTRTWLETRPEADVRRLGLLGYSKGGEFALLLASTYDWVKAVVAYAPPDYVWQGIRHGAGPTDSSWSRAGRDLPYLPSRGTREAIQAARAAGGRVALAPVADADIAAATAVAREAARIKLEHSHAALLLIGADHDLLWDSGASVARMGAWLQHAGYPHPWLARVYAGAGHELIGTGWRPTTSDDTDFMETGGSAAADAHAQAQAWEQMLDFLAREL